MIKSRQFAQDVHVLTDADQNINDKIIQTTKHWIKIDNCYTSESLSELSS